MMGRRAAAAVGVGGRLHGIGGSASMPNLADGKNGRDSAQSKRKQLAADDGADNRV